MGQVVSSAAKPKRCNLNQLSQVPTPAAGEYILVSSDNSMNAAGQGNFDCYIVGDGTKAATALTLHKITDLSALEAEVFGLQPLVYTNTLSVGSNISATNVIHEKIEKGTYKVTSNPSEFFGNASPWCYFYNNGTTVLSTALTTLMNNGVTFSQDVDSFAINSPSSSTAAGEFYVRFVNSNDDLTQSLKERIKSLYGTDVDIIDSATYAGYIRADGTPNGDDTNFLFSDWLPMTGIKFEGALYGHTAYRSFEFADKNLSVIGYYVHSSQANFDVSNVTIPSNTAYFRFVRKASLNNQSLIVKKSLSPTSEEIILAKHPVNLYQFAEPIGYIDNNGAFRRATNWGKTPMIPIKEGTEIEYYLTTNASISTFTFYDKERKLLSLNAVGSSTAGTGGKITAPANSYFVVISGNTLASKPTHFARIYVDAGDDGDVLSAFSTTFFDDDFEIPIVRHKKVKLMIPSTGNIVLYGDSISSTDYPWYKQWMEEYCDGITVNNNGNSGKSTAQMAADSELNSRLFAYNPNLVIILLGGNDTGEIVGTFGANPTQPLVVETDITQNYNGTYFIQAMSHIIRKVKAHYYNIIQRSGESLPVNVNDADAMAAVDNVVKPYIAIATTLPRNVGSGDNTWKWRNKRNAIVECCNKYDVHCIDLCYLTGIDWSLEPTYTGPTDKVNSYGIYTMDGLHPNKWGYERIVQVICGEINIIKKTS